MFLNVGGRLVAIRERLWAAGSNKFEIETQYSQVAKAIDMHKF